MILHDLLVRQALHLDDLFGRHGLEVGEVEAQTAVGDVAARLLHMIAQHLAQRPMQDVRSGVVAADTLAARHVDGGMHGIARAQATAFHLHGVRDQALLGLLRVQDRHDGIVLRKHAGVADLAALLSVEGRSVQHHATLVARLQHIHLHAVFHERQHARFGVVLRIAEEFGGTHGLEDLVHHAAIGGPGRLGVLRIGSASALALLVHAAAEAFHINFDAALVAQLSRDLHGEAVRIVQRERAVARQHLALELGQRLVEERAALAQV